MVRKKKSRDEVQAEQPGELLLAPPAPSIEDADRADHAVDADREAGVVGDLPVGVEELEGQHHAGGRGNKMIRRVLNPFSRK